MKQNPAQARRWAGYDAAVMRLVRAVPNPSPPYTSDMYAAVTEALRGLGAWAWQEMDQRAGYRTMGSWFALVRATRDSPTHGPLLIAAITEAAAPTPALPICRAT